HAANEIAVAAFLAGQVGFTQIVQCVANVLACSPVPPPASLDEVIAVDREARIRAREVLEPVR
ncbi:1-deoxy-D-xylulose-5-phosphate reductoisomerase, partial [Acinetobacter baumannii]